MHQLGLLYLAVSNRTFPGGDRYTIRSLFEPFAADANCLAVEASTQAGLRAGVAKLGEMLKGFPKDPPVIPHTTRVFGGVKDTWDTEHWFKMPAEMPKDIESRSVAEVAKGYKGQVVMAGDDFYKVGLGGDIGYYTVGGISERFPDRPLYVPMSQGEIKAYAVLWTLGYRAVGGRTHRPFDHYGAMSSLLDGMGLIKSGVLSAMRSTNWRAAFVLSGAFPSEYLYDHSGNYSGAINLWRERHAQSCLMISLHTLDYVLHHCRPLDDRTRAQMPAAIRQTAASAARSTSARSAITTRTAAAARTRSSRSRPRCSPGTWTWCATATSPAPRTCTS